MDDPNPPANFPKQAVVLIHGVGEQVPMETLRGFVRAVWETDDQVTKNGMPQPREVWSKPDAQHTGSLELRRITTRQSTRSKCFPIGVRTDFYELYWADLSAGATLEQLETWAFGLLWRNPFTRVPRNVFLAWLLLWLVTLAILYFAAAAVFPSKSFMWELPLLAPLAPLAGKAHWIVGILSAALALFARLVLVPTFGRVVRYTRAKPDNIAARNAIRERGLALFAAFHDGQYERIIVVGHSLGSILAYDLVSYFWAPRLGSHTMVEGAPEFSCLREVEEAVAALAKAPGDPEKIKRFHEAQRALCHVLRSRPKPEPGQPDNRWLITDLITLGSPLAHADFLLTKSRRDLRTHINEREYPTTPPVTEELDPKQKKAAGEAGLPVTEPVPRLMSFNFDNDNWQLHHAAPFAAVRWTNIYDPSWLVFFGDIVSGSLGDIFGPGVVDVNMAAIQGHRSWRFTHTLYWTLGRKGRPTPERVTELRSALDLSGARLL